NEDINDRPIRAARLPKIPRRSGNREICHENRFGDLLSLINVGIMKTSVTVAHREERTLKEQNRRCLGFVIDDRLILIGVRLLD
ncbi:hypothetical protein Tco_0338887, partial [Tanacetum coccineum]